MDVEPAVVRTREAGSNQARISARARPSITPKTWEIISVIDTPLIGFH